MTLLLLALAGVAFVLLGVWLLRPRRQLVRDVARAGNPTRKRTWSP